MDDKFEVAIPGATQNEIELEDAKALVKAGVKVVLEGANMPSTADAIEYFHKNDVTFGAAKVGLWPFAAALLPAVSVTQEIWLLMLRVGGKGEHAAAIVCLLTAVM